MAIDIKLLWTLNLIFIMIMLTLVNDTISMSDVVRVVQQQHDGYH
jgi:hypothetical protein